MKEDMRESKREIAKYAGADGDKDKTIKEAGAELECDSPKLKQ